VKTTVSDSTCMTGTTLALLKATAQAGDMATSTPQSTTPAIAENQKAVESIRWSVLATWTM